MTIAQVSQSTLQEDFNRQMGNVANQIQGVAARLPAADRHIDVALQRTANVPTIDQALWAAIRNRTGAMGFNAYNDFIDRVMCENTTTDKEARLCTKFARYQVNK